MSMLDFDPTQTRPYVSIARALPAGEYQVQIVDEAEVDLENGRGRALALEYQVLTGLYRGQRVRERVYLWHDNPDAVAMARSILAAIGLAVGAQKFVDSKELHRRPFNIVLSTRVYNGKEYNNFDGYFPLAPVVPVASVARRAHNNANALAMSVNAFTLADNAGNPHTQRYAGNVHYDAEADLYATTQDNVAPEYLDDIHDEPYWD